MPREIVRQQPIVVDHGPGEAPFPRQTFGGMRADRTGADKHRSRVSACCVPASRAARSRSNSRFTSADCTTMAASAASSAATMRDRLYVANLAALAPESSCLSAMPRPTAMSPADCAVTKARMSTPRLRSSRGDTIGISTITATRAMEAPCGAGAAIERAVKSRTKIAEQIDTAVVQP